jgi:BirA family transcriptional regulator, biotin operon repressor / biotin---[acetyl-CoA-carboxylase] ligase
MHRPPAGSAPASAWEGRDVEAWRREWQLPALHIFSSVGSTNDVARALAAGGAPGGATVMADEQTAGRGRHGRRWQAPAGSGLLLSVVLRLRLRPGPEGFAGTVPIRVGLAVAHAIEDVTGINVRLKWPNDILVDAGKVAGILCEGALSPASDSFVIAGIGINVGVEAAGPWATDPPPASLEAAAGHAISRPVLAGALVRRLRDLFAGEARPLQGDVASELTRRDALRGHELDDDHARPLGVALGIEADGALLIRAPDGRRRRLAEATVRARPRSRAAHGAHGAPHDDTQECTP